jgi:hypothetical protein
MIPEKHPRHALLLRWGKCEVHALGIPAIVAVVLLTLLGARWMGLI